MTKSTKDYMAQMWENNDGKVNLVQVGRKDGQPLPGEDEPLHAYVTAPDADSVNKAVRRIRSILFASSFSTEMSSREVIQQGVEVPEGSNELRKMQLRELALLNGTLREDGMAKCTNCGATAHKAWQCQDKANVTNNVMCGACGGMGHTTGDCKARRTGDWQQQQGGSGGSAGGHKMDQEYMSLMAELGEGPPPPQQV